MKIKANYKNMIKSSDDLKIEGQNLDQEIDNLLAVLIEVQNAWKGQDSIMFCGKAEAYFKNIKQISGSIKEFGAFMKFAENSYETRDLKWKSEIEQAGVNFGDEELKHRS